MRNNYKSKITKLLVLTIFCFTLPPIHNTFALNYESNLGIGFTFNPTLSVSLSSNDLIIPNLVPGSSSDSNSINVSVATNAAYGYTLSANVGSSDSSSPYYNSSDLILNANNNNGGNISNNVFTSIVTNANLSNLDDSSDNNIWGYSYKDNTMTNPSWSNYNGLSSSSSTVLLDNSNTADSTGSIDFKIAAKAGNNQASGVYTGVINFTVVSNPAPKTLLDAYEEVTPTLEQRYGYYKMQDMTSELCDAVEQIPSELQVIDIRDDKVYWIAKLADGNCWMTQNLDLDLSHDIPLTSETTDLNDSSLTGAYSENYAYNTENKIIIWTPENTTRNYTANTGTTWSNDNNKAHSLDPNNWYWNGNDDTQECNYLKTTCKDFAQTPYKTINTHGQVGNYYNWSAAIASDNSSNLVNNTFNNAEDNPQNSICPKNWRLPIISNQTNEIAKLNYIYNFNSSTSDANLIIKPLYLTRSGFIFNNGNLLTAGYEAYYLSSTLESSTSAMSTCFRNNNFSPAGNGYALNRSFGRSIRCIAK